MSDELSKAIVALKNIIELIDQNLLVRNTENDHDIMLFMKQGVKITNTIREAMIVFEGNKIE